MMKNQMNLFEVLGVICEKKMDLLTDALTRLVAGSKRDADQGAVQLKYANITHEY